MCTWRLFVSVRVLWDLGCSFHLLCKSFYKSNSNKLAKFYSLYSHLASHKQKIHSSNCCQLQQTSQIYSTWWGSCVTLSSSSRLRSPTRGRQGPPTHLHSLPAGHPPYPRTSAPKSHRACAPMLRFLQPTALTHSCAPPIHLAPSDRPPCPAVHLPHACSGRPPWPSCSPWSPCPHTSSPSCCFTMATDDDIFAQI
jgi:hypothetical protein